jgi:hypothetical protein
MDASTSRRSLLFDLFSERWFTLGLILVGSTAAWLMVQSVQGTDEPLREPHETNDAFRSSAPADVVIANSGAWRGNTSEMAGADAGRFDESFALPSQLTLQNGPKALGGVSPVTERKQENDSALSAPSASFSKTQGSQQGLNLEPKQEDYLSLGSSQTSSSVRDATVDSAAQVFVIPSSFEIGGSFTEKSSKGTKAGTEEDLRYQNPFQTTEKVELTELKMPQEASDRSTTAETVLTPSTKKPKTSSPDKDRVNTIKRASTDESGEGKGDEKLGVPPPKEQPQFLRNDSVLLKPGAYQWEVGISYAFNASQLPIGQEIEGTSIVANVRQVNRTLQFPVELRLGITERLQGAISLPIGWTNAEVSVAGLDEIDNNFGIGDLGLSFSRLIREGDADKATILGVFAMTAPTGEASPAATLQDPSSFLGRGYFSCTTGLTAIRSFDPIVLFGGFGYIHNFEGDFGDLGQIDPGEGGFYRLGIGFAVNSKVSLSTAFSGAFVGDTTINGRRLGGTSREPLSLRLAATILNRNGKDNRRDKTFEPSVTFGLNEDSVDSVFGLSWTY